MSPVADACRWPLLLLSPLLSAAVWVTTRTVQGMARVRSGQAPAWPLSSGRSVRRGSGVKRDVACTSTRRFPPVLVALRAPSRLMPEGRIRTLSGPFPVLSPGQDYCSWCRGVVGEDHPDTLASADHRADRKEWLLSTLGVPATDPARYAWEPVAPTDPDHMEHSRRLLHAVADRMRWQTALAEARRRAQEAAGDLSATGRAA